MILIHCALGRHRSVAILVAYLISRLDLTVSESMAYIRSKRACAIHYELSEFTPFLENFRRTLQEKQNVI